MCVKTFTLSSRGITNRTPCSQWYVNISSTPGSPIRANALTHPGGSHKDEFLACCLLLADHLVPIVRREFAPEIVFPSYLIYPLNTPSDLLATEFSDVLQGSFAKFAASGDRR
ncbi:MAG: hypothetical protein EOO38_24780 [Cytophagaceae bacterium]|nr:MAG: hypothetical protein EOO38_24780 [Cytophagaceae bacterium]